jgi:hypothetical protein
MNRTFLSGKVQAGIEVAYTPKGEKILSFPLWVDEGNFKIDVVFLDRKGLKDPEKKAGQTVVVSGTLTRTTSGPHGVFRLKATNILWMEE